MARFKSKQMRSFPFFLGTVTREFIHTVGEVTGAMTSCCSRSSKAPFAFVFSATGMRRGHVVQDLWCCQFLCGIYVARVYLRLEWCQFFLVNFLDQLRFTAPVY